MKKLLFFFAFSFLITSAYAQLLSETERQIIRNIEADMPATPALLKESVNINSGTYNTEGVRKTGTLYLKNNLPY
jgi:glutamate carboxypeptidase